MARNSNVFMCCKDCADRHLYCHSDCEKYLQAKAEYKENLPKRIKEIDRYEIERARKFRAIRSHGKD